MRLEEVGGGGVQHAVHGLIDYVQPYSKAKCRHLKKLTCKWTLRQVFIRVHKKEIVSHVGISTQLCELLPLQPSLWFNYPPFPVWIGILYTRIQCVWGGHGVLGLIQIDSCRKVPLRVNFFRWRHFALPSMRHIFLWAYLLTHLFFLWGWRQLAHTPHSSAVQLGQFSKRQTALLLQ